MELKEVLESKIYVNEVNNITFASPKEYLNPFIDIVGDDNIVVVGTDKIVNKNEDDTENVSYARVRIEKRLDTHNKSDRRITAFSRDDLCFGYK